MEPVRLEILLDDKTLKGMRSVEGNLSGIGLYAKQVIAQLEQELQELQKQYRNAMAAGTNTDAQMADIQALQGVIRQLKAELQGLEEQKQSGFHSRWMACSRLAAVSFGAYLIASVSIAARFSLSSVISWICPNTITLLK